MNFQKLIVIVKITCGTAAPIIENVDVMQLAGRFDSGMVLKEVQNNHPGCKVEIIDVQWVISNS